MKRYLFILFIGIITAGCAAMVMSMSAFGFLYSPPLFFALYLLATITEFRKPVFFILLFPLCFICYGISVMFIFIQPAGFVSVGLSSLALLAVLHEAAGVRIKRAGWFIIPLAGSAVIVVIRLLNNYLELMEMVFVAMFFWQTGFVILLEAFKKNPPPVAERDDQISS